MTRPLGSDPAVILAAIDTAHGYTDDSASVRRLAEILADISSADQVGKPDTGPNLYSTQSPTHPDPSPNRSHNPYQYPHPHPTPAPASRNPGLGLQRPTSRSNI